MFLKNKNIIFKIRRSKVTDYAALSDFLISNEVLGGTLWMRLNIEISKSAVLLANEHQSNQKKCYK